jgi:hypothetical protein
MQTLLVLRSSTGLDITLLTSFQNRLERRGDRRPE